MKLVRKLAHMFILCIFFWGGGTRGSGRTVMCQSWWCFEHIEMD